MSTSKCQNQEVDVWVVGHLVTQFQGQILRAAANNRVRGHASVCGYAPPFPYSVFLCLLLVRGTQMSLSISLAATQLLPYYAHKLPGHPQTTSPMVAPFQSLPVVYYYKRCLFTINLINCIQFISLRVVSFKKMKIYKYSTRLRYK